MKMPEGQPCRDFERGVCTRGDTCKFSHPENVTPVDDGKVPICKDFQSKFCGRAKCKFLHLTAEEEAHYNSTGILPEHGGHPEPDAKQPVKNVCKNFVIGKCMRGTACKYSHSVGAEGSAIYGKRQRLEYVNDGSLSAADIELIKENDKLMEQIEEVQKQLSSLRQTNDTLFEQNTRYRSQVKVSNTTPATTTTAAPSLLTLNDQPTQSTAYSQNYQYNPSTYSQYNQSTYQYAPSVYPQYNQSAYTQSASAYQQYPQSATSQYTQPTYQQYSQHPGYTTSAGYWSTYPQYG